MLHRKIFALSVILTLIIGVGFFVFSGSTALAQNVTKSKCENNAEFRKANKEACAALKVTPSPSTQSTSTPSTSPTASPSTSPTASTSPVATTLPLLRIVQQNWKTKDAGKIVAEDLKEITFDDNCGEDESEKATSYAFEKYVVAKNITISSNGGNLSGKLGALVNDSYLISNPFSSNQGETSEWKRFNITISNTSSPGKDTIQAYYRVSDEGGINKPDDKSWIRLSDPTKTKGDKCGNNKVVNYKLDRTGKYFQYMIKIGTANIKGPQVVRRVNVKFRPSDGKGTSSPTPTPTGSVTPDASGKGKLTILSEKVVASSVTPSPSGPPLPNLTPSPSPTPSTKATPSAKATKSPTTTSSATPTPKTVQGARVNPVCFAEQEKEAAPGVGFSVKQTAGGNTTINDEATDEEGQWKGLNGETDDFPAGTYTVNFKDFEKVDYKLVALCVTPDDGQHYLKTQTTASGSKATIIIRPGEETKVTALYAPRSKPYVTMSKFALDAKNKILKSIVPGQSFRYLIRYENTGESDAQSLTIQDVLPEQFYVSATENEILDDASTPFKTSIDAQGRTIITKTIGTLKRGQKGSMIIPVTLRPDAFGNPDEIAGTIETNKQQAADLSGTGSSGTSGSTASSPAGSTGSSSSSGGRLELE